MIRRYFLPLIQRFFLLFSTVIFCHLSLNAQISTLPYTETFSTPFTLGNNIDFIPNWFGNEVDSDNRVYQTPEKELAMVPTGSFDPEVQARLNLSAYNNVAVTLKARSLKNGDGNRAGMLYAETSYDGGLTWNTRKLLRTFPNDDIAFSEQKYILPGASGGKRAVLVRFLVLRGDGEGTSAKIIMDDVRFFAEANDITPPEIIQVETASSRIIRVRYNESMNTGLMGLNNYQGLPNLSGLTYSPDGTTVTLNFTADYGIGKDLTLTVDNVYDRAGNKIAEPFQQRILYNNTRPNIAISEIMYNTPAVDDSLEFLEIYNKGPETAILGGLYFSAGLTMTLPEYQLGAGRYLLLASNARAAKELYGGDFLQWQSGSLDNSGENLEIKNSSNQIITSVKYERTWGGDGNGRSISYCYPAQESGNNNPQNWSSTTKSTGKFVDGKEIFASPNAGCENIQPEIRFNAYSTYAFEGATTVKLQIISVNPNSNASSVTLILDENSTATLGTDFTSSRNFPAVINFPPNTRMQEVEIQILDDTESEGIEKAIFKLINPVNAAIGGRGYFEIDILDNDAAITHVCINELCASNNSLSGIKDEFGNSDDWIELKNGGDDPIILAGYFVTDNPNNLTKHQLPITDIDAVTIPAHGYLILWADNEPNQGAHHLDFALSASGEYFALVMPDGKTIVDEITFPPLRSNTSYGRTEDCSGAWIIFETPTFMAPNKPTSVITRQHASSIVLYPNPNSGYTLFVSEPIDYMLFDQSGRMLFRDKKSQQIDVSSLSNGMYILTTEDGYSTKFIISR